MEADRQIAEGIREGKALIAAGRLAQAERAYLDLLARHPQAGRAHFHLGQIYMRQRRWADAIPALRAALALQPENTKIRTSLERAVLKHGQPAEQEAIVESEVAAVNEIAKSGALGPAILRYRDIANRYPESALVWRQLARAQAEFHEWPAAVESAQKALAIDPTSTSSRLVLARALIHLNRLPEASNELDLLISLPEALPGSRPATVEETSAHRSAESSRSVLREINERNGAALLRRMREEVISPEGLKKATIKQLTAKPSYIGFVEAEFLADLNFVMFLCDRDDGVALRLLWKREFEAPSLAIWRRLVLQSDLAVDVGGHTGIYSIVAGLANPMAEVHTFEPHELNFARLLLNLKANGLSGKNAHNLAASRTTGALPFRVKIHHYLQSDGSVVSDCDEFTKKVPAAPIDDHVPLTAQRVCVKIDTEGHEVDVLAGMPKLLSLRPDIILECAFVPAMLETEAYLKAAGYRFFHIDDSRWTLRATDSLGVPPPGVGATARENVLMTCMTEGDVRKLFGMARADYEAAPGR